MFQYGFTQEITTGNSALNMLTSQARTGTSSTTPDPGTLVFKVYQVCKQTKNYIKVTYEHTSNDSIDMHGE